MFSIIIPLYNKAAYVEKAIRSVLNQTCQEFELIVVNDGSTDSSLNVVQQIIQSTSHTIVIIDQPNQGVSSARNNGVKVAKNNYIAFLDADDWWEPTYLDKMKGLIGEFPEAGIYGSSYYKVKNKKLIPANIGVDKGFESGLINYFKVYTKTLYMPLWTGATVIKKDIFECEDGFKSTLKLGEDFDLWIRVAMKYPIALLNKQLAFYNQDVELSNRAIGEKLYEPNEHILFTDYHKLKNDPDFRSLFEKLAVYGLLPYYVNGKNKKEVASILSFIIWKNHSFKYFLYYRILPKFIVRLWMNFLKLGSIVKTSYITKL